MPTPPRILQRFFRWFCHPQLHTYIEGDLLELHRMRVMSHGKRMADLRFALDVMLLFRPSIIKPYTQPHFVNRNAMIKNYFTIGWRTLLRDKGFSFINIGGLAIGMAVSILIGLWVYDELSYNKNFVNYDRVAQVMQNQTFDGQVQTWGSQAMQLGPELRTSYGNYFKHVAIGTFPGDHKLVHGEKAVTISGSFVEPGLADMLSLQMVHGSHAGLGGANAALISRSAAVALFGNDDPINKIIRVDMEYDVAIAGVYEDLPDNCSFAEYDVLLAWQLLAPAMEKRVGWGNSWFQCLVQLADNVDLATASEGIRDAKLKRVLVDDDDARFKPALFLHPMSNWRLYGNFKNGVNDGGAIQFVRMFALIAAFVLALACINFMNLSTARSEKRAREVGIRKAVGSLRSQLVSQFFAESLLIALLAAVLAIVVVQLALPWFNGITAKHLTLLWQSPWFWLSCVAFTIFTGLLAGVYPALFLSGFRPATVLRGAFNARRGFMPRKVLVVLQFTVSVTLIVCTVIIFEQLSFAQQRAVGYDINSVAMVGIRDGVVMPHFEALRDELLKTGVVKEVSATESAITSTFTANSGFTWNGKAPGRTDEFVTVGVTYEFGKTIGWTMAEGRDFSREVASDTSGFIINRAAAKYLDIKEPLGETMTWNSNGEWKIIGIVDDMVTQSPYNSIKPMIFFLESRRLAWIQYNVVNLKLAPTANPAAAMDKAAAIFKKYDPENAFDYRFADEEFGRKFNSERRIASLAVACTSLAIFISCLGLFGMASFVAAQRTKEVGIRKILGASAMQLWQLLSRDFVVLVIVACIVAIPISFYLMNRWLMQYDYRIDITWHIYAIASLGALAITLLTVSIRSVKAAVANPVNALRAE